VSLTLPGSVVLIMPFLIQDGWHFILFFSEVDESVIQFSFFLNLEKPFLGRTYMLVENQKI
jgi:hypothetical protein